jgi:hypothetical protein
LLKRSPPVQTSIPIFYPDFYQPVIEFHAIWYFDTDTIGVGNLGDKAWQFGWLEGGEGVAIKVPSLVFAFCFAIFMGLINIF